MNYQQRPCKTLILKLLVMEALNVRNWLYRNPMFCFWSFNPFKHPKTERILYVHILMMQVEKGGKNLQDNLWKSLISFFLFLGGGLVRKLEKRQDD